MVNAATCTREERVFLDKLWRANIGAVSADNFSAFIKLDYGSHPIGRPNGPHQFVEAFYAARRSQEKVNG